MSQVKKIQLGFGMPERDSKGKKEQHKRNMIRDAYPAGLNGTTPIVPSANMSDLKVNVTKKLDLDSGPYLAINDALGNVEFANHAKRNGTSTWLGVVELAFKENGVNSLLLGKDLSSASTRWTSSNDRNLVLHVQGRRRLYRILGNRGLTHEGRRGEGGCHSGETSNGDDGKLHLGCKKDRLRMAPAIK